jgi:hypothetical protein
MATVIGAVTRGRVRPREFGGIPETTAFDDLEKHVGKYVGVKGTWWQGGSASDRRRTWKGHVVKYEMKHKFEDGIEREGLLISFADYVIDEDEDREFWFVARGNKSSYVSLKTEHDGRMAKEALNNAAKDRVHYQTPYFPCFSYFWMPCYFFLLSPCFSMEIEVDFSIIEPEIDSSHGIGMPLSLRCHCHAIAMPCDAVLS